MKERFVAWLSELDKTHGMLAGGKGSNLGEMYRSGFPVPQAFVVTTDAYSHFMQKTGIADEINNLVSNVNVDDTAELIRTSNKIKEIIINAEMPEDLKLDILESYDHLNVDLNNLNVSPNVLSIMKSAREPVFVSVRSSATAEDLKSASFAGQQESFINIKGNENVILNIKKVFASIFTARSIFYRKKKGFEANVKIAAVVQRMINSDKSGVMFSIDPVKRENVLIEAVFGQGEGIVSGRINPDRYIVSDDFEVLSEKIADKKIAIVRDSAGNTGEVRLNIEKSHERVLKLHEIKQLAEYAKKLERHYNFPQDIEFAVESGNIYILQTRAITTLNNAQKTHEKISGNVLVEGMPASPGVGAGIVKIVNSMKDLAKVKEGDILVTKMTNPDMVVSMQKASGIVTDEGGATCHAAIVSREMGIPAIVGTDNATQVLKEGMEITVDGNSGKVFQGISETKKVEILPIVKTKTKIKVMVDLPDFAERAAKSKADGIGLIRLEGIIASSGKHPLYYVTQGNLEDYTKVLEDGLSRIAEHFIGKEMWIRTPDIRSDEYSNLEGAPKEIERNPMMGFHGIRFSLKNIELFKAELMAVKNLIEKGHKFGLMFPQVIGPEEVLGAKKMLEEMGMLENENLKIGVMIETPAAVVMIDDICQVGINFISFGTNDLTQFTLAIDRGNEDVQYLYDESNWAILKQLSRVIRTCKKYGIETSICGQAGSKKEVVEFLVKQGINSISVNADVAKEISEFVAQLEAEKEAKQVESQAENLKQIKANQQQSYIKLPQLPEEAVQDKELHADLEVPEAPPANTEETSEEIQPEEAKNDFIEEETSNETLEEVQNQEEQNVETSSEETQEINDDIQPIEDVTQPYENQADEEPLETEEAIAEEQEPQIVDENHEINEVEEDIENSEDLNENPEIED